MLAYIKDKSTEQNEETRFTGISSRSGVASTVVTAHYFLYKNNKETIIVSLWYEKKEFSKLLGRIANYIGSSSSSSFCRMISSSSVLSKKVTSITIMKRRHHHWYKPLQQWILLTVITLPQFVHY